MNSVTKGARRIRAQIFQRSALDDSAFVHQHDLVAEVGGFREVVSDEDGRLLQPRENFLQVFLQRGADQRIERAERFVEEKQLGR